MIDDHYVADHDATLLHARVIAAALRPRSAWACRVLAGHRDDDDAVRAAHATLMIEAGPDSAAERLVMARAMLQLIAAGQSNPRILAQAGLDFCDLTEAERAEMRGDPHPDDDRSSLQ